jgi:hypothetical protein
MDTGQKTESLAQLVEDIDKGVVALPEFQRDFVWDIEKTLELFDSFVRDIFVGSLIYGVPSFEITVRELDKRARSGKGSRAKLQLTSYNKADIDRLVKTSGFRLLLDGQQRATSIYRALRGVDNIYFVLRTDEELEDEVRKIPASKRTLEQVLSEFSSETVPGRICIGLHDAYRVLRGEASRERDKVELFMATSVLDFDGPEAAQNSDEFEVYLTQLKNLENLLRQEKLVAYYLLDTDENKFALFFERSNSKGIQLNFIDILAAKLYVGFNLRAKVAEFKEANSSLELNREVLVRSLSYSVSGGKDTSRAYILTNLTHSHFSEHWETFTTLYVRAHTYLSANRLLIHPSWLAYENILIPLMAFLRHIPHYDFAQITQLQGRTLRNWYWLTILSRRYSSAAQSSVLEDAQALEKVAIGDYSAMHNLIQKLHPVIREPDDLISIHKKYDALYKGILNLVNFHTGGFRSLQNGQIVTWDSNLEDHHIFPKDFLAKSLKKDSDVFAEINCVVNRTLIPKLTNIKASNKPPSVYLRKIQEQNPELSKALASHLIPEDTANGTYDDVYELFLEDRSKAIMTAIEQHVISERADILKELGKV